MSTWSLTWVDMTAGLAATSCSRRVRVGFSVQSQSCVIVSAPGGLLPSSRWIVALALRLHVVHGGPVSRGRGAISATDLKVDVERRGGLNICPFVHCQFVFASVCVCVCVCVCVLCVVCISVLCL